MQLQVLFWAFAGNGGAGWMLPLDILKECLAYLCRGLLETCSHVNSTPVQSVTELRYLLNILLLLVIYPCYSVTLSETSRQEHASFFLENASLPEPCICASIPPALAYKWRIDHCLSLPYFCLAPLLLSGSCPQSMMCPHWHTLAIMANLLIPSVADLYTSFLWAPKTHMHDWLWDAIWYIVAEIGPHAGVMSSWHDVLAQACQSWPTKSFTMSRNLSKPPLKSQILLPTVAQNPSTSHLEH
jgi:hypothetical protein